MLTVIELVQTTTIELSPAMWIGGFVAIAVDGLIIYLVYRLLRGPRRGGRRRTGAGDERPAIRP